MQYIGESLNREKTYVYIAAGIAVLCIYVVNGLIVLMVLPIILLSSATVIYFRNRSVAHHKEIGEFMLLQSALNSAGSAQKNGIGSISAISREIQKLSGASETKRLLLFLRSSIRLSVFGKESVKRSRDGENGKKGKGNIEGKIDEKKERKIERNGVRFSGVLDNMEDEYRKKGELSDSFGISAKLAESEILSMRETEYGKMSRYLMTSTLLGSILPSLATLAFVSYSIISFSMFSVLVYFTMILGVMPFLYWISKIKINDVYDPYSQ